VDARLDTMYGRVASAWKLGDGRFQLSVTVPPNTRATVRLPGAALAQVTEGGRALTSLPGVAGARQDGKAVVVEVGSGTYAFAYPDTNLELPAPSLPAAP
jgi:alpha-L-rhamnosidase